MIDRETWELAQAKLAAECARTSFAPRNPAYYLKQLFVCGHCGKNMTGRTEVDPNTKKRTVVYVCSSYIAGRCGGHATPCGYHRITHEDAERLLLDKIAELNLPYDEFAKDMAHCGVRGCLATLRGRRKATWEKWETWYKEGLDAIVDYLRECYGDDAFNDYRDLQRVRRRAMNHYFGEDGGGEPWKWLPGVITDTKSVIEAGEAWAAEQARQKMAALADNLLAYTRAWPLASGRQQTILKAEADRLQGEIAKCEGRSVPLTQRLNELYREQNALRAERQKLLADWATKDARVKGEAMRRLFSTVTLFWHGHYHPARAKPSRPRKTNRPGRYSYSLERDRIGWQFATSDLAGSRSRTCQIGRLLLLLGLLPEQATAKGLP